MKERQRWQPEEDALLRAYVKQYGPRDWGSVSERTGKALDRDAKSCVERWKNYLKPGIKKGPLSEEEQNLVISLQEKYGNKWKKIAAEVPGRTAKRLGKWWEVYKEKEKKERERGLRFGGAEEADTSTKYSEMLASFAEKFDQRQAGSSSSSLPAPPSFLMQPLTPSLFSIAGIPPNLKLNTSSADSRLTGGVARSHATGERSWLANSLLVGPPATSRSPDSKETDTKTTAMTFLQGSNLSTDRQAQESGGGGSSTVRASTLPPWMSILPSSSSTLPRPPPQLPPTTTGAVVTPDLIRSNLRLSLSTSPTEAATSSKAVADSPRWSPNVHESEKKIRLADRDDEIMTDRTPVQGAWYPPTNPRDKSRTSFDLSMNFRPVVGILDPKNLAGFVEYWKGVEDQRKLWLRERSEMSWKLRISHQQLEAERIAKSRQKMDEVDARIRVLREEERKYLDSVEEEYKERLSELHRTAEMQEKKFVDSWIEMNVQLTKLLQDLDS